MNWVVRNIKWVMLISGVLTCSMLYAAIAPSAALQFMFGESLEGPLAEIIVRNWGALIAIVGAMLIYGAFSPSSRGLVLSVACVTKAIYVGLFLSIGTQYLTKTGASIVFDSVLIIIFCTYLLAIRRNRLLSSNRRD